MFCITLCTKIAHYVVSVAAITVKPLTSATITVSCAQTSSARTDTTVLQWPSNNCRVSNVEYDMLSSMFAAHVVFLVLVSESTTGSG